MFMSKSIWYYKNSIFFKAWEQFFLLEFVRVTLSNINIKLLLARKYLN